MHQCRASDSRVGRTIRAPALLLTAITLLIACGQTVEPELISAPSPAAATQSPVVEPTPTLSQVLAEVQKSVVQIKTPQGVGSGFIFEKEGLILTNAHVVGHFPRVSVLAKGLGVVESLGLTGEVVGVDEAADLAVVSVTASGNLPPVAMGDSESVALGEEVLAIGFALSPLLGEDIVVTRGIVSSRRRVEGVRLIQTDAALNPGVSGGPLLNHEGKVIGISTLRIETAENRPVERVGFAIPINHVRDLLPSLKAGGPVAGEYAGTFTDITHDVDADMTLRIVQDGENLKGIVEVMDPLDRRGSIEGTVDGDGITFALSYLASGQSRTITFEGGLRSRVVLRGDYTIDPTGEKGRWEVSRIDKR